LAAKVAVGDLKAASARIRHFRSLFERLFEAETKLDSTFSEWDRQPLLDQVRSIRREMTRLADDVHKDLARRGTDAAMLYLRDAPVLGGRVYLVPLVQALIDGSARAYNVTPDTVDVQFEAVIAWYEKQLASASHDVPQPVKQLESIEPKPHPERSMRAVDQRGAPVSLGLLHTSASLVGLITGAVAIGGWILTGLVGLTPWWPF
jgi:hypothetical protein